MELVERIDKQVEDAKKSLGFHSLFDDNDAATGSKELLAVLQDCKAALFKGLTDKAKQQQDFIALGTELSKARDGDRNFRLSLLSALGKRGTWDITTQKDVDYCNAIEQLQKD